MLVDYSMKITNPYAMPFSYPFILLHHFRSEKYFYLCYGMRPDYPHKIFNDKRANYCLLMQALAMDATA